MKVPLNLDTSPLSESSDENNDNDNNNNNDSKKKKKEYYNYTPTPQRAAPPPPPPLFSNELFDTMIITQTPENKKNRINNSTTFYHQTPLYPYDNHDTTKHFKPKQKYGYQKSDDFKR